MSYSLIAIKDEYQSIDIIELSVKYPLEYLFAYIHVSVCLCVCGMILGYVLFFE